MSVSVRIDGESKGATMMKVLLLLLLVMVTNKN